MNRKEKEQKEEDCNNKTKMELRDSTIITENVIENRGFRCSQIFFFFEDSDIPVIICHSTGVTTKKT